VTRDNSVINSEPRTNFMDIFRVVHPSKFHLRNWKCRVIEGRRMSAKHLKRTTWPRSSVLSRRAALQKHALYDFLAIRLCLPAPSFPCLNLNVVDPEKNDYHKTGQKWRGIGSLSVGSLDSVYVFIVTSWRLLSACCSTLSIQNCRFVNMVYQYKYHNSGHNPSFCNFSK
jgi:hypothetical protein